jgi:uncharacterized membrane protein
VQPLLWVLVCFGGALVLTGVTIIVVGIAISAPTAVSENESASEKSLWVVIAERLLDVFDRLIDPLLDDHASRSKRLTALGLILIVVGGLCIAGGVYGIGVTAAA